MHEFGYIYIYIYIYDLVSLIANVIPTMRSFVSTFLIINLINQILVIFQRFNFELEVEFSQI